LVVAGRGLAIGRKSRFIVGRHGHKEEVALGGEDAYGRRIMQQ
jgi:hypothetical protein